MTTIAMKIKELMANMPDTLNTKKEIDDYYKDAMKKSVVSKSNKKDAKPSDDADKPKKELNGYQLFMKEHIKIVKEENPSLTGPEVFSKIAELWKKKKEDVASGASGAATSVPVVAEAAEVAPVETVVKVEDEKAEVKKKKK